MRAMYSTKQVIVVDALTESFIQQPFAVVCTIDIFGRGGVFLDCNQLRTKGFQKRFRTRCTRNGYSIGFGIVA
jgi:hypothetical protein